MAVEALLAAEMRFLRHCRAHLRAVVATCRALAEGVDCEWSTGRLARVARAIERGDVAVLHLAALDDSEWRFAMMRARRCPGIVPTHLLGRRLMHVLPPAWRPRSPADLVAGALVLTPESVAEATAHEPRYAAPDVQRLLLNHTFWPELARIIGRATTDRGTIESADRRMELGRPCDLMGHVGSDSPDYSVALRVNGVAVAVAPLMVMVFAIATLEFDAPADHPGPFRAHYTRYMVPKEMRERRYDEVLLDDEVLYRDGCAYRLMDLLDEIK